MGPMRSVIFRTNNMDLNLFQAGEEICSANHSFGPAVRQHYLFHYILSGSGTYRTECGIFSLGAGEGFLIYPGDVTIYEANPDDPWHYMWLEFDGAKVREILKKAGIRHRNPIYRPREKRDELLHRIEHLVRRTPQEGMELLGWACLFFSELMENSASADHDSTEKVKPSHEYVQEAVRFLERRYFDTVTIEEVAAHVGINRSYLGRLFKEELGMAPQQYLQKYRMDMATALLQNPNLSVNAVGNSVGYPNQMHFSRAFRQTFGVSPRKWRDQGAGRETVQTENS